MTGAANPLIMHASAVSVGGRGLLILGASGAGKSSLALQLLAHGALLIADDRTCLGRRGDDLIAWAPPTLLGHIEARGVGLLQAEPAPPTPLYLIIDLDLDEPRRLPTLHRRTILGWNGPLLQGGGVPNLPWALLQFMKTGRTEPA